MTITNTILTLASIGSAINAADVTTPDSELLALINALVNASSGGDVEQFLFDQISTPSTPASTKWKAYFKSGGFYSLDSSGGESLITPTHGVCEGRLTLTSGTPITTSDVTAATTVYFTPYKGNRIGVYNGTFWILKTFTELSLSLAGLAASTPHDIFVYDNAGTLTLEALAWTNDTTRATALTTQNGVYVKSGATTRRYLGTIRTTGTIGQTEDSLLNRLVWNMHNRAPRDIKIVDTTDSWTYTGTSWRSLNNSTSNRATFVRGLNEDAMFLNFVLSYSISGSLMSAGIGLDSTSSPTGVYTRGGASIVTATNAHYAGIPGLGYHYLQLLEYSSAATTTYYGDNGGTFLQSGAVGMLWS